MCADQAAPISVATDAPNANGAHVDANFSATGANASLPHEPKRRGFMGCCPTVQHHTMLEAGGSRCLPARVLMGWRILAGIGLLMPIVLSFVLRTKFGDWIVYALNSCTFLVLSVCSYYLAGGREAPALSSAVVYWHTFAGIVAACFAPWYIYWAVRDNKAQTALGVLPYAAFLADVLLMQAHFRPPFHYGLPGLVFFFVYLLLDGLFSSGGQLGVSLLFAGVAVVMLFVNIGLTRICGLRETPTTQGSEMPPAVRDVNDDMWS